MIKIKKNRKNNLKKFTLITIPTVALMASFVGCSINKQQTEEINLIDYLDLVDDINTDDVNYKYLSLDYSDITNEDLDKIPSYIENLSLVDCHYITDLSRLPEICPNLKYLFISECSSITNYDFIYELPYLESVHIYSSAFVTPELRDYLVSHNIRTNISDKDLSIVKQIDDIVDSIIEDDMNDTDKVRAITLYLMENYEYDEALTMESNYYPLECMIENKRGVCAGYAYLANALLRKAGVNAYEVVDNAHAWNLVEEDDKYYYLDTTCLDSNNLKLSVKMFDKSPMFLSDPRAVVLTPMTSYDKGINKVLIPKSFVEDIKKGEDLKSLKEKYGTDALSFYLKFALVPILVITALDVHALYDLHKAKKEKREEEKKKR